MAPVSLLRPGSMSTGTRVARKLPPNGFTLTNMYLLGRFNQAQGGDQVTELDGSGYPLHVNAWEGGRLSATYSFSNNAPTGLHF